MKKISILLIDDATLIRARIEQLMKDNQIPADIFHAGSCTEGVDQLKKEYPDVVILDINLPDYNGIKLLHYIKENNPDTKTIVLTNHAYSHYREACLALGAYDFIDKSLEFTKIVPLISWFQSNLNLEEDALAILLKTGM